ncbi:MAG: hypothetical protein HY898_11720 [Deltaproteobacteria bacterium]|nr:hypothetical protein [Deltaproteobacteria bacterium]
MPGDRDEGLLPGPARQHGDESAHVRFDRRELSLRDPEKFDRVAFAMRALRLLKPAHMTVVVYEGNFAVRVHKGPDLRHGPESSWGMIAVPPHASRAEIAVAVVDLAGRTHDPYAVDLVMAAGQAPV